MNCFLLIVPLVHLLTKDPTNENKAIMMITYYDIDTFTIIITINNNDTVTVVVSYSKILLY
jgi:hypothetical protein